MTPPTRQLPAPVRTKAPVGTTQPVREPPATTPSTKPGRAGAAPLRHPTAGRARTAAARATQRIAGNAIVDDVLGGTFFKAEPGAAPPAPDTPAAGFAAGPAAGAQPDAGPSPPLADAALIAAASVATPVELAKPEPAGPTPPPSEATTRKGLDLLAGAPGFFGREPGPKAGSAAVSAGGSVGGSAAPGAGAEAGADGLGGPPPPGQPQTVAEWEAGLKQATGAMPGPKVRLGGGAFAPVTRTAAERGGKARGEAAGAAARQVPPRPRVPEPPKPPEDPVPEATKRVTEAAAATLSDLTLPALMPTPTGRKPELPPPRPLPPPKEADPATAKPTAKGTKRPTGAAQLPPKGPVPVSTKADEGPPPPPTLKDVRVPIGQPLRPDLAMRVGDVVGKLLEEIEPITNDALDAARRSAFAGGRLTANFLELNDDARPPLSAALTEQVNLIGDLAGISRERVESAAKKRADALAESKPVATVPTEAEAKAAADAVKKEERKTAEAITKERGKALKEMASRMHKAMTSTDPQFIGDVRDELIGNLRVRTTRGAAQQRRAGSKRIEELKRYEALYREAYRKADNADIPSTQRGVATINRDAATGRPWLDVRLEEVAAATKASSKEAEDRAEVLAKATEGAGLEAYELVREWTATRLGWVREIDVVRIEKFADQRAQAERRTLAESEVKAEEARNALLGDIMLIDQLAEQEGAKADAKEKAGQEQLSAEEKKLADQYFGFGTGPRDPLAALARTTRARLVRDRQPELVKQFTEKVEAFDPFTFDKAKQQALADVLWGDPGAADQAATNLYKAMEGVGTEEDDIYKALAGLTPMQAKLIRATYLRRFEHTLEWALRDEMSGSERDRALALATGDKIAAAAETLYDAVDGPGTKDKLVYDTLRNLSPEELQKVKEYYRNHHNKESLETALKDDFSDREQARALALAAGDKNKADAYAVDEALQGSIWGPDRKQLEEVHKQIADDVAKANPRLSSEDLAKEVRRRTGEVEASYEKGDDLGAGTSLKAAYGKHLTGPTRDLAIALTDNDQDGADSARFAIEAKAAQDEGRNADDQFNDIVKARHERMLDKARRDDGPDLEKKLAAQIADRDAKGNPMTPWERQKAERDMQVELQKKAQEHSKAGMSTLAGRFDEKYTGSFGRYDPSTQQWEMKTGGFAVMSEMLSSGPETKAYLDKGHLTLAEEIRYSVEGAGTNEDRLKNVTKGRTKEEISEARKEYKGKFKEDMDERIRDEVDWGTRDRFDVEENLKGVPETPKEMLDAAKRRYTFETTTYGAGGLIELAPTVRKVLDEDFKDMQAAYERLNDPDPRKKPTGAELEKLYGRFESTTKTLASTADLYRKSVDAMVDVIVQVVAAAVAIAVIAATWGTATPLVAALYASLWGTAATITTKMILLGNAYGVEDLGKDLALGAVDAAIAVATAGMGDKLLRAAKGAANPGVLARMAASSSKLTKVAARASAEVIEQTAQAGPNALANTLLDDNTYRGDVFKNIIKGTAMGTVQNLGTGLAMGGAMRIGIHVAGGIKAGWRGINGLPPPDAVALVESAHARATERAGQPGRPADALELRGTVQERAAAWAEFRRKYPGASYRKDFLPALDRGSSALQVHADVAQQVQRRMRAELMSAVPPGLRGHFGDTPIHVVSDADFEAFGRSRSGQAIVVIEDGKARVIVRESAGPGALREEGIHLWQSADPRTAAQVAQLDEAKLGRWDSLTVAEKIDLYRTKLALEVDGQHRLIEHLDGQLRAADLDSRTRAMLEADLHAAHQTLDNLHAIKGQVDVLRPDDLVRISRGEAKAPVDLEQPSRLFSKRTRKSAWKKVSEEDARLAFGEIEPTDVAKSRNAKSAHRIGPEFHDGGDGPYRHVIWEDAKGERHFTVEKKDVKGHWVERGEMRRARGLELETEASAQLTRDMAEAVAPLERHIPLAKEKVGVVGPGGFDEVVLVFGTDGKARFKLVEVKHVDGYVPWKDITAIDDTMRHNLNTLRSKMIAALPELAKTHNLSAEQVASVLEALTPRRMKLDVEIRLGPNAKLGTFETGRILPALEADLRRRYGGNVRVLDPVRILPSDIEAAAARVKREPTVGKLYERVGALAATPTGITPESALRAHALALAEVHAPAKLGFIEPDVRPPGFFTQDGRPVDVLRPGRPSAGAVDTGRMAQDLLQRLEQPHWNKAGTTQERPMLVVDFGALSRTEQAAVMAEVHRLAEQRSVSADVTNRLLPVRTGSR